MRLIHSFTDEGQAFRLRDYLFLQGIQNRVEADEDGTWGLWIFSEEKIPLAESILHRYLVNPKDSEFQNAGLRAQLSRAGQKLKETTSRTRTVDVRTQWHRYDTSIGPVTMGLIGVSILVAVITKLGSSLEWVRPFLITEYQSVGGVMDWRTALPEIRHGEVWRLITPIFIHFGFLHLLFNMMWLKDLGTMIERYRSSLLLAVQIIVIGALSNLVQYFWSGPVFGGMSGVVYGLLGYCWMESKFAPRSKLTLNQGVVSMMILWFVVCIAGLMGPIANGAHAGGLVFGMIWGFADAKLRK